MGTDKKDKFGLWSIVLLGINSIIGTGIFLLPNRAYALMGPSSLLILLFDAFLAGCLALCFAEVAGFFSRNGGPYLYAKAAFGDFVGYEVGVLKLVVTIIAWAAMAVGFATALGAAFPFFAGDTMKNLIAAVLIGGLTIMNIAGVKISKILNNLMTISKLVPLCVFIAVGLFFVNGSNFTPFVPTHMADGAFANAAITMFFAYTGFEAIAVAAEDFKDPKKDLPRGIILTMIIVTIISAFFWSFAENPWVQHALTGVRACVCALIINSTIRLYRKAVLDLPTFLVFLTVLILAAFVGLSPAILVVGAGLFGLAYHCIRKERPL